jgi:lipid-binding SYLF domain-containing protein
MTTPSKKSAWDRTKTKSMSWFEKVGQPVNKLSNKLGAEAFWPTSLDKESDKAARILRSFCIDGFTAEHEGKDKKKQKVLDHIPPEVIRNARGLAIFTVMRMGLHWSGAGGSGIIVSRLPNGQWSPPSGILIHTLGWGFIAGADIYDCVCVINNEKGMEGFTMVRATLGGEISASVGPLGAGSTVDSEVFKRQSPVWTYTKSKGLYLGVQIDGTIIVERTSENERFYGVEKVRNKQILAGAVTPPTGALVQLWETLQASEGASHDQSKLPPPNVKSPGDLQVEAPRETSQKEYDEFADHTERMDVKT